MKNFFRMAALFDWVAGLGLIFGLEGQVRMLELEMPNYPGIFTLLGGVTLLFGWLFWQVALHPENRPLFQMALLAKIIPFLFLTGAALVGSLPRVFLVIGVVTDGLWIPPFVSFYRKKHRKEAL